MEKYLLHALVLESDIDGVNELIAKGKVDLNELDEQENSALHWAVLRGDYEMVSVLLKAGAHPNIISGDGFTPKWSASDFGLTDIENILTSYGGKIATDKRFERTSWAVFKNALGQELPQEEIKISRRPAEIYRWCIFLFIAICIILKLYKPGFVSNYSDEALQSCFLYVLTVWLGLMFITSIFTTFFYFEWFKRYWYVNVIIFTLSGFLLFFSIWVMSK